MTQPASREPRVCMHGTDIDMDWCLDCDRALERLLDEASRRFVDERVAHERRFGSRATIPWRMRSLANRRVR